MLSGKEFITQMEKNVFINLLMKDSFTQCSVFVQSVIIPLWYNYGCFIWEQIDSWLKIKILLSFTFMPFQTYVTFFCGTEKKQVKHDKWWQNFYVLLSQQI